MSGAATDTRSRARRLRPGWIAVCVVAVVLAALAVTLSSGGSPTEGALHGVHLTARLVDASSAQADVDAIVGPGRLSVLLDDDHSHREAVVGQLTYDDPATATHGGEYALFVIDNDSHRVAPMMWGVGPHGSDVGQGWDGRYDTLAQTHSWLRPLAENHDAGGTSTDPGTAVNFSSDTTGPVTFAAYLPSDAVHINRPAEQLTIALAYFDADGRPGWVQRLTP